MASTPYLAVLKAAYDYAPTSEDEIAIKEDQILFLIERTDDDWWRVKLKEADENDAGGLVPSAYVEQAPHKSTVKAVYDYDASAPGELSVNEDEVLLAFDADDGWLLVQSEKDGGRAGFVPENYVEEMGDGAAPAVDPDVTPEAEEAEEEEEEDEAPATPAIIIPDSPPRPSAPYIDPAERVAASHTSAPKVVNDSIQTWAVSEVDKKGKKKKGTLGIGNGSIFFASESDKSAVQKWSTADVDASYTEKNKHVHVEILGSNPINLHFHAGTKDTAENIIEKLDASKAAARAAIAAASVPTTPSNEQPNGNGVPIRGSPSPKPKKNGVSVHFATTPPSIISPREHEGESDPEGETEDYNAVRDGRAKDDGQEWVSVLYDFIADGEDELSVSEGDRLVVLEKDSDDWWKVRDSLGHEGVVPASYVELEKRAGGSDNGAAVREEEEERKHAEESRKVKAAAAAEAAELERKRREREREKERERKAKEEEEGQRRSEEIERKEKERRRAEREREKARSSEERGASKSRQSSDKPRSTPAPNRVRTWHDRTGQFKVDAEFLGFAGGKLRLHKTNGVVIEVPAEKMSQEDVNFIEWLQSKEKSNKDDKDRAKSPPAMESDDEPLAVRRKSLQPEPRSMPPKKPEPLKKKGKQIDWFEFFLNAGCGIDECTRYTEAFERDKIDESLLPDITQQTMRSIGLKEGDIIRVSKAIAMRHPNQQTAAAEEQLKKDEEYARKLQEEESAGRASPRRQTASPGLFAGPGGALKNNTRRGRPQSSKNTLPSSVDLASISTASEQMTRQGSPSIPRVSSPQSVGATPSTNSLIVSGFDDDAWTNRPSSTQPPAATPPLTTARAPSAPPTTAQAPPAPAPPPAPMPPVQAISPTKNLANTTESDVFEQLARLSALRVQSPATSSPISAAIATPPPPGFQNGMGMGSSPVPMGQIQPQPTGVQVGVVRGPFAPVPQNQGLLQPLVPTSTGFNSFVPTRPQSNPPPPVPALPTGYSPAPLQPLQPQQTAMPLQQQPAFLNIQPTGFQAPQPQSAYPSAINIQPTGFAGGLQPQQTGFPGAGPIMSQTTSYPGAFAAGPFSGGRAFGSLQPNVTGYQPNTGFGQVSSLPPVPPLPNQQQTNSTAPANVFASMKSGTFGNESVPQASNKYDALRPQPTGWGIGQQQGYQNGYSGSFY